VTVRLQQAEESRPRRPAGFHRRFHGWIRLCHNDES
jgi:hypothetical protein